MFYTCIAPVVLEEKIAQEWLSSDDDSGGEEEVDDESATETLARALMSKR